MSVRRKLASLLAGAGGLAAPELVYPTGLGPLPWSLPTLPVGWIWADGAVLLSSTPYAALRAAYIAAGFPYGQDGSGNPKVPDMRGRVPGGKDNLGGTAAGRLTSVGAGVDGATLGAAGGSQTHTLTSAQIPAHTHTASTNTVADHAHGGIVTGTGSIANVATTGASQAGSPNNSGSTGAAGSHSHTVTVNANTGGDGAHNNTQPTLVVGYIVKT